MGLKELEKKLLKTHQINAANIQTISDLKAANRIVETNLRERQEKIDCMEREKAEMTSQFQNTKIADDMHINDLKLKVNIDQWSLIRLKLVYNPINLDQEIRYGLEK